MNLCTLRRICEENHWHFVLTFKEGRFPAVWQEFQTLLAACPEQVHVVQPQEALTVEYRWVNDLSYQDDQQRRHSFHAVQCQIRQEDSLYLSTANGTTAGTAVSPCIASTYVTKNRGWHFALIRRYNAS
jgi:hypothetical protein